jgi:lipopolysaccharide export system ATP-binding protein
MPCSDRRRRTAKSILRVRRRDPHAQIDLVSQAIHGFEAGVRNLWASFRRRRPPPSRHGSADDDWPMPIELDSLGGLIPDIRGEPMDLSPARPRRRREPAAHVPRPEPAAQRAELKVLRKEPQVAREAPPLPQVLRPEPQAAREAPPLPQVLRPEPQVVREAPPLPPALRPEPQAARSRLQAVRQDQPSERPDGLAAIGLSKSFSGRKVVNNVNIHVRRGEAVGLLGPNGAGKTTVFYMITGLIKADRGRIELDGKDVTRLPMYQRARLGVGYLPQEASIFRGLNVEENIRAVLEVTEPDRRRREADLGALMEEFGITRLRKTPSIALSGGERRRVEIARALASRPSYMLLDEPFAGIDPKAVVEIQRLVRHLTNRGIGVLITDHNVRETLDLTDRSYIIYSGAVLMEGGKDQIVNDPEVRRLYLGEDFRT